MKSTCARDKKLRELNLRAQMLKSWTVFVRCLFAKSPFLSFPLASCCSLVGC